MSHEGSKMTEKKAFGLERPERCTGCGACAAVCGRKAIDYFMNEKGFYQAFVDVGKCVLCGNCVDVCPANPEKTELYDYNKSEKYIARVTTDEVYNRCASGGVASALYLSAINSGMKIIGTAYDCWNNEARAEICSEADEIELLRGSKYLPTNMKDVIGAALEDGSRFLVCGLPCQIYGIKKAAEKKKVNDRFVLVELCCHGVPSMLIWDKFLKEINPNNETVTGVSFLSHSDLPGRYTLKVFGKDGPIYLADRSKCVFYQLFDDAYCISGACYHCRINQRYGVGDIKIGDYYKRDDDSQYFSKVFINTSEGKEVWRSVSGALRIDSTDATLPDSTPRRNDFVRIHNIVFGLLEKEVSLKELLKKERKRESAKAKAVRFLNESPSLMRLYRFLQS